MKTIKILIVLIISVFMVSSCAHKKEDKQVQRKPVDTEYDNIQKLIIENYSPKEAKDPVFCVYETIWIQEETYYTRRFVYAFIQEIKSDLSVGETISTPVGIVFDKQKNEIIRNFSLLDFENSKNGQTDQGMNIYDSFPPEAFNNYDNISTDELSTKIEKMQNEVMNQAKKYYQIKEEKAVTEEEN